MTTKGSPRMRWVSLFGLVMLLMSATPFGVAAQNGLVPGGDVAQIAEDRVGPTITMHVSTCEPGAAADEAQLKASCHENGTAGVTIDIAPTDPANTTVVPQITTAQVSGAGPGVATSVEVPEGQYRVQVNIPGDSANFFYHCELANSETVVGTSADANGAENAFLVSLTRADDIVCDAYVIPEPSGAPATMDITYRTCTRGDLPSDDRTFATLDPNCTTVATTSPTVSLRARSEAGEPVTEHTFDAEGALELTLNAGNYDLFSNLSMDDYGEYMFCQIDGGAQYQPTFIAERGVFQFDNVTEQNITCDWFAVQASDEPSEGEPPVVDPEPQQPAPEVENGTIAITMMACPPEFTGVESGDAATFQAGCAGPVENMVLNLTNDADITTTAVTLPSGQTQFENVPAGDFRMWSEVPMEAATEYYFCSVDGGAFNPVQLSDRGVAAFADLTGEQQINCQIYVVAEDLRGDVTGASVEVHLSTCPIDYTGSNWYADCHDAGVDDMPFVLTGPGVELTQNTVVERTPGPGIARFTELPAGDYVLSGGPPQDFGSVFLYCSDPATGEQLTTTFEGGKGQFAIAENQSVVCDWYFVPDNASGITPTPTQTPAPTKAEIFTTMFVCPTGVNVAGSTFGQLDDACSQPLSNVPMTLQSPGGVPITANTGESGEGAIRFFDLTGGDYVLTPSLPAEYVSAAVYCDLNGGDVYQKALSNGSTTFVDVAGEKISCSWFVTAKPAPQQGPTGSITVREMLCKGDRATIVDWERECQPGTSGVSFTITSSNGATTQTLTPNASGVAVFSGLPNENYELKQSQGAWCRAKAERVDGQSRVIVTGGGNTDVFLYQCNQELGLPSTGSGTTTDGGTSIAPSIMLGAASLPLFALAAWQIRRSQADAMQPEQIVVREELTRTNNGYRYR